MKNCKPCPTTYSYRKWQFDWSSDANAKLTDRQLRYAIRRMLSLWEPMMDKYNLVRGLKAEFARRGLPLPEDVRLQLLTLKLEGVMV